MLFSETLIQEALATASNRIAAILLTGGSTLHSTFKITLDLHAMDIPI